MKNPFRSASAFTLVEMMVVVALVFVLVSLGFFGMGVMNQQQSRQKALSQLAILSNALEHYKKDTGDYPATVDSTTGLGGGAGDEVGIPVRTSGSSIPMKIYHVLYLEGATHGTTIYCADLGPANLQGWLKGTDIVDPWGKPYRYRSALSANGTPNPSTSNPDFDLWTSGRDGINHSGDDLRNVRQAESGGVGFGSAPAITMTR